MIIVDGRESQEKIASFANLEEVLANVMNDESMNDRIVTDVLVNNESFSEIYPHQAGDMPCDDIESVEIRTEPSLKMAVEMSGELGKVARMMASAAESCASLLREGKDRDALELFQNLLDVTRDFMGMLSHLRISYLGGADEEFGRKVESFSDLLSEMSEVLESEDLVLLSDLLEYEFAPRCEEWRATGDTMHRQLSVCCQ